MLICLFFSLDVKLFQGKATSNLNKKNEKIKTALNGSLLTFLIWRRKKLYNDFKKSRNLESFCYFDPVKDDNFQKGIA